MSGNQRRESVSSDRTRRTSKSRLSSQSSKKSPNRPKTSVLSSKTNSQENTLKRSKSSITGSTTSGKKSSSSKKSKQRTKFKTSTTSLSDNDAKQINTSEYQDLSARGLSTVPSEIFSLSNLRYLCLSNNNLSGLPSNIRFLTNLEHLDLSKNPLRVKNGQDDYECLPKEMTSLKKLRTLSLSECTLKCIPVAVWHTTSLHSLDLSRNKVGYILGEIGNLSELRHIRFSQMDLGTLPAEIGFCEELRTIDLTGNSIDSLPETLVECRKLSELKINYQTFHKRLDQYLIDLIDEGKIVSEHLPSVIFELESLKTLDLTRTHTNHIPMENALIRLTELDLSFNSFQKIPSSLSKMVELKSLNFSHNFLESIDENIIELNRLEVLIVSNNKISVLPSYLGQMSNLKSFVADRNRIESIEKGFSQSRTLIHLDLSFNQLEQLDEEFSQLKQIETVDLRSNRLDDLPLSMSKLTEIRSLNSFDETLHRIGLHLIGNPLRNLPSEAWKTTNIQTLFQHIQIKEKSLSKDYFHLKLILLSGKSTGKTSLMNKLINNQSLLASKRQNFDIYRSMVDNPKNVTQILDQFSESTSSAFTDQWIETKISTSLQPIATRESKIKRLYPPALSTYRGQDFTNYLMNQSTFITKNNLYCTVLDLKYEQTFQFLYPSIFDSQALFLIPINLTLILEIVSNAKQIQNLDRDQSFNEILDLDYLLNEKWLQANLFRFIESISDHCLRPSIIVLGLMMKTSDPNQIDLAQTILDEIFSKVNMFITDENQKQRSQIRMFHDFFPNPVLLDDEQMSSDFIQRLETISQQLNYRHEKNKRKIVKRAFGLEGENDFLIDLERALENFEKAETPFDFESSVEYLKLTGDLVRCGSAEKVKFITRPYYVFNQLLCRTLFRPRLDEWLNYEENLLFHFSGFYPTKESFEVDREKILRRGQFSWSMLKLLFIDESRTNEEFLIRFAYLVEDLRVGFVEESNSNYHEFETLSVVCPCFLNENASNIDPEEYFICLERQRQFEKIRLEHVRQFKKEQLWFAADSRQGYINHHMSEKKSSRRFSSTDHPLWSDEDLPKVESIEIDRNEIFSQEKMENFFIERENRLELPDDFYRRLLIELNSFLDERFDFSNLTFGRSADKDFLIVEFNDERTTISIRGNVQFVEKLRSSLESNLFAFFPSLRFVFEKEF